MSQARLFLFGHPYLMGTERVDLSDDALLLLAYLVLHARRPITRQRLAFTLWPDMAEVDALRRLRQQLHTIRRTLTELTGHEDILISEGHRVWLNPDQGLWVDVVAFRQFAAKSETYEEAAVLYQGDLLAPFHHVAWLQAQRVQLRETFLTLLRALAKQASHESHHAKALKWAKTLIKAAPWRESAQRLYMEMLAASGRRIEAIQHYRRWEADLRRQFGLEPAAETRWLYQRLCQSSTVAHPRPLQTPSCLSLGFSGTIPLVGREDAWAQLEEGFAHVQTGRGRAIFVVAENGLGRSFLLEQWFEAHYHDFLGFMAGCHGPDQGNEPGVIAALRAGWEQVEPGWFPSRHPALEVVRGYIEKATATQGVHAAQIAQFLLTLARRAPQPLVLVLKNIHEADPLTWEVLTYLTPRCVQSPVYLLASCPPPYPDDRFAQWLRTIRSMPHITQMPLRPLTLEETASLAAKILGHPLEQTALERLYQLTEGYPYFIVAYAQAAKHGNNLWISLPQPVSELMQECLARVGETGQRLLACAARFSSEFTLSSLVPYLSDLSEEEQLKALESCLRRGLLFETPQGYRFAHIQIRLAARNLTPNPHI